MVTLFAAGCAQKEKETAAVNTEITQDSLIKNGEYLVTILGCNDCHSPKRMGANGPEIIPELTLSGYPSDRPLGQVKKMPSQMDGHYLMLTLRVV